MTSIKNNHTFFYTQKRPTGHSCRHHTARAAYKKHVSFGFGADMLQGKDSEMLEEKGYKIGKGTVQIKFDQKVPTTSIKKLLKAKMNEAKSAKK